MKKSIISTIVSLSMTQLILAQSPPWMPLPPMPTELIICPGVIELPNKPESTSPIEHPIKDESAKPNDYSVSLLRKKGSDICKGVIIAPSWVLTAKHCATKNLTFVTDKKLRNKKRVVKKFRFKKGADIALLKIANAPFDEKSTAIVLGKALRADMGKLTYKKVTHNTKKGTPKIYHSLTLVAKNTRVLKSLTPKGKAGSSGSPWVVDTDMGDVVIGVTHGGARAPQIAQAKKWINALISKNTPNETVKWITDIDTILEAQ